MIRVISEPVCRDAEGTEGGEAALAEGDRRELGDVDAHGQVSLREVEASLVTALLQHRTRLAVDPSLGGRHKNRRRSKQFPLRLVARAAPRLGQGVSRDPYIVHGTAGPPPP